jgi:hypothetical protein
MRTKRTATPNKKVRNATALSYYGIKFKSKLELHCYKLLKEANIKFQYEKVKFELIPGFTFPNDSYELFKKKGERYFGKQSSTIRPIKYTPDFVGYYPGTDKMFVIETKGNPNDAFPIRWKLFKRLIHTEQLDLDLYMPRNQKQTAEVIDIILKKNDNN